MVSNFALFVNKNQLHQEDFGMGSEFISINGFMNESMDVLNVGFKY